MAAHEQLIQGLLPKGNQTNPFAFIFKLPDMFPEFGMDVKIQRNVRLFQQFLQFFTFQQ